MRVVCVQAVDVHGNPFDDSPWLTAGQEYVVLAIRAHHDRDVRLLLDHGDADIGWWPVTAFRIIDEDLPPDWTARLSDGGILNFAPRRWQRPGFWADFVDGDEDSVAAFREDRDRILRAERGGQV